MKTKNLSLILFFTVFLAMGSKAEKQEVISPDGKLIVTVFCYSGEPAYSISLNGQSFLESSPLGMRTNVGDFSTHITLLDDVHPPDTLHPLCRNYLTPSDFF